MAGTRWVKLDVDYFTNPKIAIAGREGRDLHLVSICWVGRHLTDGFIPSEVVTDLAHLASTNRTRAVAHAVNAGLWLPTDDGYVLHDFVTMNGTRADVEKEREQWRERQRRYRGRQRETEP